MDTVNELEKDEKEISANEATSAQIKNYRRTENRNRSQGIREKSDVKFKELAEKVEKFVPNSEKALKLSLAVAASGNKRGTPMLWLMLVGNPSSGKTEVATLIRKSINTYAVDNMTVSAFITGERETSKKKVHDLLPQIDNKCFLIKDWTSLFNLYEDMIKKIIGDLVNIYDEEFTKFSAARGNISYKSNFSHLGCITPATLNKHQQYLSIIGARFLFYSIPELTKSQKEKSFDSIFEKKNRRSEKKKLTKITSKFLNRLSDLSISNIKPLSKDQRIYLMTASEFLARARGIVIMQSSSYKGDDGKNITYYEVLDSQVEAPWRAVQQLIRLSKYLALVEEEKEIGEVEMEIIKEVVLSSMPANRAKALDIFKAGNHEISAKDLSRFSNKSYKTSLRLLDELVFLGILDKEKGTGSMANSYNLKEDFRSFVTDRYSDFVSSYSNGESDKEITDLFDSD